MTVVKKSKNKMNKLLKDAIADAKAVRETALANAKVALEEAFAPKLQSMLSHKIKEEMGKEGMEGEEETSMEDQEQMEAMQKMAGITNDEDPDNEGMKNYMEEEEMEMDSEEEMEMDSEEEMDMDMDMDSEEEMEMDMDSEEGEEVSDEELEEILRELEGGSEEESEEETMEGDTTYMESEDPEQKEMDEEINLEEIIAALNEEDESEEEEKEEKKTEEELEEAYNVIKFLRSKLNEVNLLNAKLLFVNKLFKKGELTETQKVKIIETFDRAKNVREAKLIYATLAESVNGKAKKPAPKPKTKMNEGLASAPSKATKIIAESNNVYSRFKTLVEYNNK
jgi:hypothetical protein